MRRKSILMTLLIAAAFVLLLSACGSPTPTSTPTARPTVTQEIVPTATPTQEATTAATEEVATAAATEAVAAPTAAATEEVTAPATMVATAAATEAVAAPTAAATEAVTAPATMVATAAATEAVAAPTAAATEAVAAAPTATKVPPTVAPSDTPTVAPSKTPTVAPSDTPTVAPSDTPTVAPSDTLTVAPSKTPTEAPTAEATKEATMVAAATAEATAAVTAAPTAMVVRTPGACKVSGELTVGTDAAYPPFENVNTTTNKIEGFDIDLLNAIGAKGGFTPVYQNAPFDTIFTNLAAGQFDIVISAATITAERSKTVTFSNPYFAAGQVIVVRKGDEATIKGPADLVGKKIGVQLGTTGAEAAKNIKDAQISPFQTAPEAFQALANKDVDAVVNDNIVSYAIVQSRSELNLVVLGEPFTVEYYGIVARKECPELTAKINEGLAAVIADGTYADIYGKWMGSEPTKEFQAGGKGIQLTPAPQPTAEATAEAPMAEATAAAPTMEATAEATEAK
jgi:ABC-type amino acid transport substrate-binding protein